ncbi:MAG: pyruvate ferredoxin oxidoreductase [Xanthomonadaceae bacterium]|nr:pyruvate ferredoxin oxidoreductase [Rhodospirillaceae bacterium]NIA17812.1 pyruvate ferredoxin oxidoreductase [Xanthomonadaceae bacterium]
MRQILEGSRAVAKTIKLIKPAVVSAYPITPQTHIVEDLAKFKADGEANYEYVRAESEFAAASIVLGASATGVRVYTATSSQGLLLMEEVIFNIAGMRLPVVLTCANRGVSAPITIWNDHQDVMAVRDAGWITLFAENSQEAVDLHLLAYKIAEKIFVPVMVNIDGFVLTHTYEPVKIPSQAQVNKFLPNYHPKKGTYLDVKNPRTFGAFASPAYYMEIRQELHEAISNSKELIKKEINNLEKITKRNYKLQIINSFPRRQKGKLRIIDSGLVEYYGLRNPEIIFVAMGSMVGTIKDFIDRNVFFFEKKGSKGISAGVLKVRSFNPFPSDDVNKILNKVKFVAVLDKDISLGKEGILAQEIKAVAFNKIKAKIQSFIVGLGGRDITGKTLNNIVELIKKKDNEVKFVS